MLTKWNKPEDITGLCVGDRILMVCEERNTFGKMEKHVVILEATEDGWTSPDETYIGYTPGDGTDWISEKDFRKLLAIREAGDEEVEKLYSQPHEPEARKKLRNIAITRGQQLREAQAEIESYESQELETTQVIINHRNFIADQKKTIDSLTAELAALKSAPGMAEVEALESAWRDSMNSVAYVEMIISLARRSIAAREEVVGLLKWVFRNQDLQSDRAILSDEARRILEIVEGR